MATVATRAPASLTAARMVLVYESELTDGELIGLVADGDTSAFDELYSRYARAVLGLALRRLGDRGRAEDAVQEVFTSVWRSADQYDPARGQGAPWLYAVARNAIVDGLRRTPEPAVDIPDQMAIEPGPPELTEASWVAWRIHRALETLPPHERAVLELAYFGGQSQSEIATFLNIPLGTVKTRTRAGLAHLADTLEEELG